MTSYFNRGIEAFYTGDSIFFGAFFFINLGFFIFTQSASAYASPMCMEIFKRPAHEEIKILPGNMEVLMDFNQSHIELRESRTVEGYHESLYSLATDANRMLDELIDNIYILNTQKLPSRVEKVFVQSTEFLYAKIDTTFDLPENALQNALRSRRKEGQIFCPCHR